MAMVLDAFASYVGDLLRQVVEEELGTMLGVSSEINKMDEKLRDLKNFLTDADRRNITDESVQEWVGQLKRAMYEATDILDLCQLKAMEHGPSTVEAGCFNPLLFCMRNPSHAREIGTRIKKLNQWLNSIKERSTAFNFINLRSYDDCSSNVHASQHGNPSRETVGDFDQLGVVGEKIEEDTRALVARIMQTSEEVNDNIILVAIVGVGGIGKTTLAQKVFNDETIQGEFSKRLWLSVNQNISEIELLRRGIIEAGGDAQPAGNAKATLHRILRDALIGHKILLVMDDVWNHGAWDDVLKIPLVNAAASGSRVLITTRDEGVARAMKATWPFHNINTLTYDDAWSLLKKQALSGVMDEEHINTLKDIGLKIIQKCGGLPLAIKVMGGLLCRRGALLREWEHVLDDSKWSITGMPQVINSAVYLSYEDMPPHLKQCFLYYSLLPKGRKFHVDHVIAMWISEGFIHGDSNDLEEFGRNYYNELISRNLIEIDKSYIDRWYCSMHDVVRSFSQYMTKDETLVTHNGDINILTKLHSPKLLRLSIETTNQMESGALEWKSLQDQQSVRTLISTIQIKMKPGDSLVTFSSLRTLHIEYADVAMLVESLHQLKHLRYLALLNTDISVLPEKIGKMKLMQFLDLRGCKKLVKLPDSIVMLSQLRLLTLANASMIPRGFRALINMRRLALFRAHMDGGWCSLDELGPLSQLRRLELIQLENVSASSSAANARLSQKTYLADLCLYCTSRLGHDGLVKEKESVSEEEQRQTEKVFDELCPPCSVENIEIKGYFGLQLPSWMMSMVPLNNLKTLLLLDLVCCTQLPNGLCQLPYLRLLKVERAPCIRHVGARFLQAATAPFPRLNKMNLIGMLQWEEWDWEEQVQAMPRLEELILNKCKLRHVPPGLAFNARALKLLHIHNVQHLSYLENFPSVVELRVCESPDLERITNLPNLQKLAITSCPNLKVLESIPAIERLFLKDYLMEQLPEYMRDIKSRHLQLFCRLWLLSSIATGQSGTEWDKFSHVQHVKAYAPDKDNPRKWYVSYTRSDKCKLDSNISSFAALEETLSSSMVDAQGFESMYKMRRSTFSYVCDLVMVSFLEDKMASDHTFVDGKVMSLQDRVAVALIMLNSGEPPVVVGSSLGVSELTVSTVTQIFVEAMWERAFHHAYWPCSDKVKKIKHKFDKIHGLPNCCGVVHTDHMIFGTQNRDHDDEENVYSSVIHIVVDSSLRFMTISLDWSGSMDQSSFLHDSWLFDRCEEGTWLMGGKLELANGMDVGEYIIGDTRYPLRPWLLTPYNLEDKDPSADIPPYQAEFNKRHSSASTLTLAALERLKDTWKILDKAVSSCPLPQKTIYACCMLHNIVIDMEEEEEEEGAGMGVKGDYTVRVRQVADEDAVRTRDALSQHLMESRAAEEEQEPSRRQKQTEERRKFMITRPWKWRQTDAAARIKSWAGKKES